MTKIVIRTSDCDDDGCSGEGEDDSDDDVAEDGKDSAVCGLVMLLTMGVAMRMTTT